MNTTEKQVVKLDLAVEASKQDYSKADRKHIEQFRDKKDNQPSYPKLKIERDIEGNLVLPLVQAMSH
jgi:hypothetical protein